MKNRIPKMPKVQPRQPFDDGKPKGYLESLDDWYRHNTDSVKWFLENAEAIRNALEVTNDPAAIETRPHRVRRIQIYIAKTCGVELDLLLGESRLECFVWPRFLAVRFARELTDCSLSSLAYHFKYKNHTSVSHALNALQNRLDSDKEFLAEFNRHSARLRRHLASNL